MIDLTDYTTIPVAVSQVVKDFLDCLPNKNDLLRDTPPSYDLMVRCRLEDNIKPYRAPNLYEALGSIFDREEIICYHATKLLSLETIRSTGLRTNDWERYSSNIKEALDKGGASATEIEEALRRIKYEKERKDHNGRDRLCYFANTKSFVGDGVAGYDQFCQNVGGELARWALQEDMPNVYKILCNSGKSALVKFSIPFNWVADFEREYIIAHFFYHVASEYLWNYLYEIEFDGNLFKDVPGSSIIEIIEVATPEDYE